MLPLEQLLGDFAELVKNAGSEQDQLNLSAMAFGKSAGPALVLALAGGKKELKELFSAARAAGYVLGQDLVDKAGDVDDKFAYLEDRISGLGKQFSIEFGGPVVEKGIESMLGFLTRIKEEIAAIRSLDIKRLAQGAGERTGPGYIPGAVRTIASWFGQSPAASPSDAEREALDKRAAELREKVRATAAMPEGPGRQGNRLKDWVLA